MGEIMAYNWERVGGVERKKPGREILTLPHPKSFLSQCLYHGQTFSLFSPSYFFFIMIMEELFVIFIANM